MFHPGTFVRRFELCSSTMLQLRGAVALRSSLALAQSRTIGRATVRIPSLCRTSQPCQHSSCLAAHTSDHFLLRSTSPDPSGSVLLSRTESSVDKCSRGVPTHCGPQGQMDWARYSGAPMRDDRVGEDASANWEVDH